MFSLKINPLSIRLNNVVARSRSKKIYILHSEHVRTLTVSIENERKTVKNYPFLNITSFFQPKECRTFCTKALPKDPNVFGDIGEKKYDLVDLDEKEKNVEEFEENEAKPFSKYRRSPGVYQKMVKNHIENGDLLSAEDVLTLIEKNRDKPTLYIYSLLIRAFAVKGNVRKCFQLYNKLKKRGLTLNDAIITSLINACSNSKGFKNLEILHDFRSYLFEKNFTLNETHYNTLIKAYSRFGQVQEAFQLLDEMRDKKLPINILTFNNLLHGASSQNEIGLKYALIVWHLMKHHNVKPSIITYNLLFRAIRDTELGNLKVNDTLIAESAKSKILLAKDGRPDLLATPPVVRVLPKIQSEPINMKKLSKRHNIDDIEEEEKESTQNIMNLNDIVKNNRLILFGGFDGIIKRMENDNIVPDDKTFTICLDLIPNTKEAETQMIRIARSKKIHLDTTFFNVLIKRRCFRYDYTDAKAVLREMELSGCKPDIYTWGVLALTCQNKEEGMQLLNCIDNIGLTANYFIYGTLLRSASTKMDIEYVIDLLELMMKRQIAPSDHIYIILDKFKLSVAHAMEDERSKIRDMDRFKIEYTKFKLRYAKIQKMFRRDRDKVFGSLATDEFNTN